MGFDTVWQIVNSILLFAFIYLIVLFLRRFDRLEKRVAELERKKKKK